MSSIHITEAEQLAHVARWRASGLTRAAYSQQHGIKLNSLIYWVKRGAPQSGRDVPLTLVPARIAPAAPQSEAALVLVCPNGSRLHLPASTPAGWLGTLLSALS